jgi:hypothetical protein
MDKFTQEFIDNEKFERNEQQNHKQFYLNRKTVLRRWLNKGINCTKDFQKSFKNYKISHYRFNGAPLFTLDDFSIKTDVTTFEKKLDLYLLYKKEVYINKAYKYIYLFSEEKEEIILYHIVRWEKGEEGSIAISIEQNQNSHRGTYSLQEDNNIFINMKINNISLYLLFHDNNDSSYTYIVGTSMGYLAKDNKVPRAEKAIFSKEILDTNDIELQFILNETESISAIENRLNLNTQEVKTDYFIKYSNKFKKYHHFFQRLIDKKYQQHFYYRLAFREFYAFFRLFERFSRKEAYHIMNFQRAFFEAIKTVESIKNIPFFIVTELTQDHLLLGMSYKELKIKDKLLKLSSHGIDSTIIFVVEEEKDLSSSCLTLLDEIKKSHISVRLINKKKIIHEVNSLNFFFIHLEDERDFVLTDPIRDNKDVFKLFINEVTLDEYRTDYYKILKKSHLFEE